MEKGKLKNILEKIKNSQISIEEGEKIISSTIFKDIGFASIDLGREARCGFPEVVLAQGKPPEVAASIAHKIFQDSGVVLITRASKEVFKLFSSLVPLAEWHEKARCVTALDKEKSIEKQGLVAVLSAGTADIPVAEEARVTAEITGSNVQTFYDVGVAGIHRLFANLDDLRRARSIVVAAGMEGALPSVVAGLVPRPVIAVPTSTGYGASFGGVSALLAMLNSCASGVSVVNIDNGFGAGYIASLINRTGLD